jgi:O-acetylserine/cysteine efflux transporter|tara:strand:+ start:1530 stop:2351 length:822 start_codon:yes stop_codon:yes gene_type:complete
MFLFGSAYPTAKLGINASMPPILFGAIRMVIVFICLVPFIKFKLPNKKHLLPLLGFAFSMGAGVNLFLYLSVNVSNILSPLVIGAQLSIPLAIIFSSIFIGESISYKKWILIITSFLGIILIGFDPKIADEILGFLLICGMAFFYASAQVYSRYLKELDVKFTNAFMGAVAFIVLLILSIIFEENTIFHLKNLNLEAWLMVLHAGVLCSLMGHMSMFYLYKFYSVGQVLPFYALFPIFGMLLSFFIFGEIPTLIMVIGGIIVIISVFLLQKTS